MKAPEKGEANSPEEWTHRPQTPSCVARIRENLLSKTSRIPEPQNLEQVHGLFSSTTFGCNLLYSSSYQELNLVQGVKSCHNKNLKRVAGRASRWQLLRAWRTMKIVAGGWRKGSPSYISGGNPAAVRSVTAWRGESLPTELVDLGEDISWHKAESTSWFPRHTW